MSRKTSIMVARASDWRNKGSKFGTHLITAPEPPLFWQIDFTMSDTELPAPRLMLILDASPTLKPDEVEARVAAGDVAAVILATDENALPEPAHLRALAAPAQQRDAAVLVTDAGELVEQAGLDGVHVRMATSAPLKSALSTLKPASIVGAGGLMERHTTMEAGENGADYVLFGTIAPAPEDADSIRTMVEWWAELCEVPCVGVATSLDEVSELALLGADFVALPADLTAGAEGLARVSEAQQRLDLAHAVRVEAFNAALEGRN